MGGLMLTRTRNVTISLLSSEDILPEERELMMLALQARVRAIAPYSHYLVGAAIRWESGHTSVGFNIENCVYNVLHAEKHAIVTGLGTFGIQRIKSIFVIGEKENETIRTPEGFGNYDEWYAVASKIKPENCCVSCGQCLQDILEYSFGKEHHLQMYMLLNGVVVRTTLHDLLPARFGPQDLGVDFTRKG